VPKTKYSEVKEQWNPIKEIFQNGFSNTEN